MTKRQEATTYLLGMIDKIDPSGTNRKITEQSLKGLTDAQFASMMDDFESGADCPPIYAPNFGPVKLDIKRNLAVGKELGHDFYQQLWIGSTDPQTPRYLTPVKYMILELPVRRQAQILAKGISTTEHTRSVDQRTGQVAGDSAAAKVSYPELQILRGMGMENTTKELIKFRGGDLRGFDAMNAMAYRQGEVSLAAITPYASGVESTSAMKVSLTSMHLSNTL